MTLGDEAIENVIPELVKKIVNSIDVFFVENIRTTRRYLSKLGVEKPINTLTFFELNKDTSHSDIEKYIKLIIDGKNCGIVSEAGIAGIADPGAELVKIAHTKNIQVIPLSGPSSIILAMSASGMNGQNFAFNGYLPIEKDKFSAKISQLEKRSKSENQAQIFMETPYRNNQMLENLYQICNANTKLCIACDITLETEFIQTKTISEWKKIKPDIHKRPAIFIIS